MADGIPNDVGGAYEPGTHNPWEDDRPLAPTPSPPWVYATTSERLEPPEDVGPFDQLPYPIPEHPVAYDTNPLRRMIKDEWLTWNSGIVVKIAKTIYDEQRWDDCPILADALEEAGCDFEPILKHFREQLHRLNLDGTVQCEWLNAILGIPSIY